MFYTQIEKAQKIVFKKSSTNPIPTNSHFPYGGTHILSKVEGALGKGGVTAQMPLYILLFLLLQTLLHVHEYSIYSERLFMAIKYQMLSAEDGGFPLFLFKYSQ